MPVVGPVLDPVLDPDPAPELVPVLVGVLIPLDELALPPALDPAHATDETFGGLVVGLCRRDVAAVSGSGSSETRLRGKIEPDAAQPQAISIFSCVLAAGSSHTPYGEAHAETGPELLRARYDNDLAEAATSSGTVTQAVADETAAAPGGILLSWSLPLDETTLGTGLVVEQLQAGAGWTAVPAGELVIGHRPDDGTSTGADATNLRVLLATGWQRGTSYRIRLTQELTDRLHRSYGQGQVQDLQWSIPVATGGQPTPAVQYDQRFPAVYESYQAAAATAGGRFPAGQNRLFQGLWTDPVTGMSYARARWYDARNAHWLSEDPMGAVDSTNLYAFVGWQPNMGVDPTGLCVGEGLSCWELLGVVGDTFVGAGRDITDFFVRPTRETIESGKETGESAKRTDRVLRSNMGNRDPVIDRLLAEDYEGLELPRTWGEQDAKELRESGEAISETTGHAVRTVGHALDAADRYLLGTGLYKIAVVGGRRVLVEKGIEELLEERTSRELTDDVLRLTERNLTKTGDTILGSYPGYINKANARGASYFDIGDAWEGLTSTEREAANRHFLDVVTGRGDRILLSIPKSKIQPDTWLAWEVKYLTKERGYVWVNQWSLRPGG